MRKSENSRRFAPGGLENKLALAESRLERLIDDYGEVGEHTWPDYETRKTLAEILVHKLASAAQLRPSVT